MDSFINQIKSRFKQKDILIQIILINVFVFFVIAAINVFCVLFKFEYFSLIEYIGVSSNLQILMTRPWTIFTYMFVHEKFFHILFNLILLYAFGRIFLSYFSSKNLGSLYILGGMAGAMLYMLTFNTIPYYVDLGHSYMIGASASVTAIIFAAAFYRPHLEVRLLFIGGIKIIYIALFIFVLDIISLGGQSNAGGHMAHIGGAILGYIFAQQYLKGRDITAWLSRIIDSATNLFKPKSSKKTKMKAKYQKRDSDYEYNQRKNSETENIDHILDKIKSSGYSSLNQNEKKRLFDASKK